MLGVCYYPEQWPEAMWQGDARRMRELGLRTVRIGEFAWSRLEPEPGRLELDWLGRAIDTLAAEGLEVVLGTPTATPPKWLVDRYPEILGYDREGRARRFGSRRHYSFSSRRYLDESVRIVKVLAERFGRHPALVGWQTDNEYGCHDTVRSYGPEDARAFRAWLARRYGTVEALNEAWGAVFWSMELRSFDEVDLPNRTVTEPNPAHVLDFYRFASDQVAAFNRAQVEVLRAASPGRFIVHNFMGFFDQFDAYHVAADLDLASWDSYPLGFTDLMPLDDATKATYARSGHPDVAAFHHDLYRGVGRGRFWVMEQQPGPVNWAPHNPSPGPGVVRLWTWEALAHGAEVVSYFRWRQAPFAQEQMHAGLHRPDGAADDGAEEVRAVAHELAGLQLGATAPTRVALVHDYPAAWVGEIQPQGAEWSAPALPFAFYSALRALGLDVDVVPAGADLQGYALAVVPTLPIVTVGALEALRAFRGPLVLGPRSGSKTESFRIPPELPPGPLQALMPVRVTRVESLRPGLESGLTWEGERFSVGTWREWIEPLPGSRAAPKGHFDDGRGAVWRSGEVRYLGFWPSPVFLGRFLAHVAEVAGLEVRPLPEGVRLRRRGSLTFAFNHAPEPRRFEGPPGARAVLGGADLPPYGVAIWDERR
ncbi:MAG: beta-galactosidase [Deinococcales bacterium]